MDADPAPPASPAWRREGALRFALQVLLLAAAIWVLLLGAWAMREAFLLAFAAVIGAVLLLAATEPLERHTGLSRSWSLAAVGVAILLLLLGLGWLIGDQVRGQLGELAARLPRSLDALERSLGVSLPSPGTSPGASPDQGGGGAALSGVGSVVQAVVGSFASIGRTVAGALSGLVIVIVGAFFLAAAPRLYRQGVVRLFPISQHGRVDDAMVTAGRALRLWLLAQLISMALVGTLVGLGTWLLGVPSPLALALFAGLAEFIPLVGSVIGAVPALLLALGVGAQTTLWTLLLFIVVQQLESNVIMPLLERKMVEIPPALLLFAVVGVGLLFGILGVLVAAPLTVVAYVLVKKLYLRQTLGEETHVPGEA